ncbi:MAG: acetyl-CoA C-acyltransferase [Actinomyces sp.]|nr:MAG: acetyl-CoA C-acyltransferase [Actinomyces sp.]
MSEVMIFDAVRTPRGRGRMGAPLSTLRPHELVGRLVDELRARHGGAVEEAERLVLSCVGQVGDQGGHLALVTRLAAGLPDEMVCRTIANYCVGGLSAIGDAAAAVRAGEVDLALAGGVEMMSRVPFLADHAALYDDPEVSRALHYVPVGVAADLLAHLRDVPRERLDEVTLESHRRAARAWAEGRHEGRVVPVRDDEGGILLAADETVRPDLDPAKLAALPPAFAEMGRERYDAVIADARPGLGPIEHRHTVAHCPPIADGASLVLLGSEEAGRRLGLEPLARLAALTEAAGDPLVQLTAGEAAMTRLLERTGLTLADMDVIEYMEAFAVVPVLFAADHEVDPDRVNPDGGHLAMGHPMGATGAILVTAAVGELVRGLGERVLVVAHGGMGVGAAALVTAA